MSLLLSFLLAALNFAIAELIHKKITGRYFEFAYGSMNKHDFFVTLIVVMVTLVSAAIFGELFDLPPNHK